MELTHKLLEHPFYQKWTEGEVTTDQLAKYAASYEEFIAEMPNMWRNAIEGLGQIDATGAEVVEEEASHIELWKNCFARLMPVSEHPGMGDVVEKIASLSPSAQLGVIHAFEVQQPEVAKTKKEGLIKHYGFTNEDCRYFDEHMDEADHIAYGKQLADEKADQAEFQYGFAYGSKLIYDSLDRFMQ